MVTAFQAEDSPTLEKLAKSALRQTPTADELADTGAGFLLRNAYVWKSCSASARADVEAALTKWRAVKLQNSGARKLSGYPLGPLKANGFVEARKHFNKYLDELEFLYSNSKFQDEAAIQIAVRGFESFRQLRGLSRTDVQGWSNSPGAQALLYRAIESTVSAQRSNTQTLSDIASASGDAVVPPTTSQSASSRSQRPSGADAQ